MKTISTKISTQSLETFPIPQKGLFENNDFFNRNAPQSLFSGTMLLSWIKYKISSINGSRSRAIMLSLIVSFCFQINSLKSQTTLGANDIVTLWVFGEVNVGGIVSANVDRAGILLLKDIEIGTQIKVSDAGSNNCTSLEQDEGELTYTATQALPASTVIEFYFYQQGGSHGGPENNYAIPAGTISNNGGIALSSGGDQFMIYQGSRTAPTFIYSTFVDGTVWDLMAACSGGCSGSESVEPCSGGTFAFGSTPTNEYDKSWYNGILSFADAAEALSEINDPSNWIGENDNTAAGNIAAANMVMNSALPVELTAFSGKNTNKGTLLKWRTASEINNLGFEVETSIDGRSFTKIGFVKGKEHSLSEEKYDFTHVANQTTLVYYRLKQIDIDGGFSYSSVIAITNTSVSNVVSIQPNPTSDIMNIVMGADQPTTTDYSIFNVSGQLLLSGIIEINKGANRIPLGVSSLNMGIYYVKVNNQTIKIVKF